MGLKWASDMTTAAIKTELRERLIQWEEPIGERGGSPREFLDERIQELERELSARNQEK